MVDIESYRPVDVLTEHTARTVADWLRAHATVQIVRRDRASAHADGARDSAPDAIQVAARWHIWSNLTDGVERKPRFRHYGDLPRSDRAASAANTSLFVTVRTLLRVGTEFLVPQGSSTSRVLACSMWTEVSLIQPMSTNHDSSGGPS